MAEVSELSRPAVRDVPRGTSYSTHRLPDNSAGQGDELNFGGNFRFGGTYTDLLVFNVHSTFY